MDKLLDFLPKQSIFGLIWGCTFGLISWIISSPFLHQLRDYGIIDYGSGAFIGQLLGALSIAIYCKLLLKEKVSSFIFALITSLVFSFVWGSQLTIEVKQAIEFYFSTKTDYNYALSYILCFGFITFFISFILEAYLKLKTNPSKQRQPTKRNRR